MMLDVKVSGSITSRTVPQIREQIPYHCAAQASLASARVARARAPSRERGNNYRVSSTPPARVALPCVALPKASYSG